jgi:hypothetical protein
MHFTHQMKKNGAKIGVGIPFDYDKQELFAIFGKMTVDVFTILMMESCVFIDPNPFNVF